MRDDYLYGRLTDAFEDPVARAAVLAYENGHCDEEVVRIITNRSNKVRTNEALGIRPPFREPRFPKNSGFLGMSQGRKPLYFDPQWLNAHALIVANTGSGKTTLNKHLLLNALPQVSGSLTFDSYKRDLRDLRPHLSALGIDHVILTHDGFKLNVLQADGDPRVHLSLIIDNLNRVLNIPDRASMVLKRVVGGLYREFNVYSGTCTHWPCLYDVYERVKSMGTGIPQVSREALLDRLADLLLALTPSTSAYRQAWKPADLATHHITFELLGATENVKTLLTSHLLFTTLHTRLNGGASNARMDLLIVVEDAQRLLRKPAVSSGDIPPLDEIAGLIRGTGVGIVAAPQTMDGLSRGLIPNLSLKIMGRLGSGSDYTQLGSDMGMSHEQVIWAKKNLRPGTFIVQMATGPWREPFILKVPRPAHGKRMSDTEVAASAKPLDSLPVVFADEYANWAPNEVVKIGANRTVDLDGETAQTATDVTLHTPPNASVPDPLRPDQLALLNAIHDAPGEPSGAYAKLAGMSVSTSIKVRKELVAAGFVKESKLLLNRRGRPAIILETTDKAERLLKEDS